MTKNEKLHFLFNLYITEQIDKEQERELIGLISANESDDEIRTIIRECFDNLPETYKMNEQSADRIFENICRKRAVTTLWIKRSKGEKIFRAVTAVAAVLLIALSVFIFREAEEVEVINQIVKIEKPIEKPLYKNDIRPGGNKAILTLADGSKVVLDDAKEGKLGDQGKVTITKLDSGRVAYNLNSQLNSGSGNTLYNTISTPKGGKFSVTLPDGTTVWMNASSTLKFPTSFEGKERRVVLTGEAYFEVAANPENPFIVIAGNSRVKVCGTHFNIMAYPEEKLSSTTLLEGCVEVTPRKKPETGEESPSIRLIPGQQAQIYENSSLFVAEVDTQEAIAWKNGYFVFKNEPIANIMQKISRWYDVNVVFETVNDSILYTANISQAKNISEVLRKLELTETIKFKIEGKTITVLQ
ncbi:MAG: FecR family protein [Bacteroidales bacterium]